MNLLSSFLKRFEAPFSRIILGELLTVYKSEPVCRVNGSKLQTQFPAFYQTCQSINDVAPPPAYPHAAEEGGE